MSKAAVRGRVCRSRVLAMRSIRSGQRAWNSGVNQLASAPARIADIPFARPPPLFFHLRAR